MGYQSVVARYLLVFLPFFFYFFLFLLSIYFIVIVYGQSMSTSNCNIKRCAVQRSKNDGGLYVLWRGECVAGTITAHIKNG